jgi:hypothetical protein
VDEVHLPHLPAVAPHQRSRPDIRRTGVGEDPVNGGGQLVPQRTAAVPQYSSSCCAAASV